MSENTTPEKTADGGLSSTDLFGLKEFERDRPATAQFMADLVTSKSGHSFGELVDLAWARRNKQWKNCGEEIFRLRAFESLQTAVATGKCRKEGKTYLPNARP